MRRVIFFCIMAVPLLAGATTLNVPADYGNIQEAIDYASPGDTVLVANGTYTGDGNRDIDFGGNNVVLMSENGPEVTVIDCQGQDGDDHRAFLFNSGEANGTKVAGFKITNGWGSEGAGIYCSGASPTITDCIFVNNVCTEGGGIYCENGAAPVISECLFYKNYVLFYGGGVLCKNSSPSICNCTFTDNHSSYPYYGVGGGMYCMASSNPVVQNCIFAYNGIGGGITCEDENSIPSIECTDIFGNYTHNWDGYIAPQYGINGNFSEAPYFINRAAGNFYLQPGSPCLPENNECLVLIGARGEGEWFLCGDVNLDEAINILDVTFIIYFLYYGGFPLPIYASGDINFDGTVNILDITALIDYLYAGGPDPDCGMPSGPGIDLVGHSTCGGYPDRTSVDDTLDCIQYEYDGESLLTIHHLNAGLNCCPLIAADITIEDSLIIIEETDDTGPFGGCFCLCLFDIDYYLTNIPPGTYTIRFIEPHLEAGDEILEVTVDLTAEPAGMYCVYRCCYPWGVGSAE